MRLASVLVTVGVVLAPSPAASAAVPVAPTPTAVAKYRFETAVDSGDSVEDLSGWHHPLRLRTAEGGRVRSVAHRDGYAAGFPAPCRTGAACPRAVLEAADAPSLRPGLRRLRFAASVAALPSAVGDGAVVLSKGDGPGRYELRLGAAGKPNCVIADQSGAVVLARSTTPVIDGQWHRIVCTRTTTALTVVVDGVKVGSALVPAATNIGADAPLRVGASDLSGRSERFGGALDDVVVVVGG